jgi:hypothetical protein
MKEQKRERNIHYYRCIRVYRTSFQGEKNGGVQSSDSFNEGRMVALVALVGG